jgi:SAM-dependent methyltransferase
MIVERLRRRWYPNPLQSDAVAAFVDRLTRVVKPTDDVLDLGAGTGALNAYSLRGRARRVVGIDMDVRVGANPLLDAGVLGDGCLLPFRDNSFDVVFSIYVLEHVERPKEFVAEIQRVLRPGGVCLMLTPNLLHYVSLIASLTPTTFHRWINARRGRPADDTFETHYRLNSRRAQSMYFTNAGLRVEAIDGIEVQPNYLMFSLPTFLLGVAYERLVNATRWLSPARVNLISVFRKPQTSAL